MTPQLSHMHAQARQHDLSMAAERAHHVADLERPSILSKGWQLCKRVRFTGRAPRTAPAAQPHVTAA